MTLPASRLLLLLLALPLCALAQTDWNAGRDLARNEKPDGGAQESANPNATVPQWSYGYRTGVENRDLTLYTAAEHLNVADGIYAGYEGYGDTGQQYGAGVHLGAETYTFSGLEPLADDEIFTSVDDHSTAGNNVIRWTCPTSGVYSYRVTWRDLDSRGGDGAAGYVVINGAQKFKGAWPNGSGQGASTAGTVTLQAGDVFDVLLNANSGDSSYDTAGTRIVITPSGSLPPVPSTWDAGRDFAANENNNAPNRADNPNGLVPQWSYGYRDAVEGAALHLFLRSNHTDNFGNRSAEHGFVANGAGVSANVGTEPVVFSYCCGDLAPVFPGNMALDANNPAYVSVVRWTAPAAGSYAYQAAWSDLDPNGGNGAGGYVVINGRKAFGQTWENGVGNGARASATVSLQTGDTLDFVLDDKGDGNFDTTSFNATILPSGPPTNNPGLAVPGTANPFLAGFPNGTTASGGDDSAPAQSPVLVPGLTLNPNKPLNFAVTGSVSTDAALPPTTGPDGAYFFAHAAENGIPKIVAPINSLVGIFLSDAAPDRSIASGIVRDFSDPASGGVDYLGYQPLLGEPFFIGDGLRSDGALQNVYPPAGATRLFLGVLDGNDYFNNLGGFNVAVTQSALDVSDLRLGQSVSSPTSASGSSALIGDFITYTFHLKNVGDRTLTNVVVKDVLPGVCQVVSISDGGTAQGGTVTWTLPSLAPTGAAISKDLTVVVKTFAAGDSGSNVAAAQINQVINNRNYFFTGDGLPPAVSGLDLDNTTRLLAPIAATFTSNGGSIAPGQTLSYLVDLVNTTAGKVKGVTFSVPAPAGLKDIAYYFVDENGARLTALDGNTTVNGSGIVFDVGKLKPNEHARLVVTGYVPFDVSASTDFALSAGLLQVKKSDGFGQNNYSVQAPVTLLTGAAVTPPSLAISKVFPDGPSLLTFFTLNAKIAKAVDAAFPDRHLLKKDGSGKPLKDSDGRLVLDGPAISAFGASLNPSIGRQDDEDGTFTTVALPKGNIPSPLITVALFYSNSGGANAENIIVRDPVPEGFTYIEGSMLLNGKYGAKVPVSVENNGRLLVIDAGKKLKRDDTGLLLYSLLVNAPASRPPAGTVLPSKGTQLFTSSLLNNVNAFPDGPDLLLVGNFFVQTEVTQPQGVRIPVNNGVTYDLLYTNTGGKKAKDLQVTCAVPAGAKFLRAVTLNADRSEAVPAGQEDPRVAAHPGVGATAGQIVFHEGKLPVGARGRVRVQYTLTDAQLAKGLPDITNAFVVSDGVAPATAREEGRRIARSERRAILKASGAENAVTATGTVRALDPAVPRIFLVKSVPFAVDPAQAFEYILTIGNLSDNSLSDYATNTAGLQVTERFPAEVDHFQFKGPLTDTPVITADGTGQKAVFHVTSGLAHTTESIIVRVFLKAGSAGKTVALPSTYLSPIKNFPGLFSRALVTTAVDASQLKVQASKIVGTAVASYGASAANLPGLTDRLTYHSTFTSVVGADYLSFTNGALLIPLGDKQVFLTGPANSVSTSDPTALTDLAGTTVINNVPPQSVFVRNLGAIQPGGQRTLLYNAAGVDAQTILTQVINSDPANVVARRGATLSPAGALNLCGATPGTFVSNDPVNPAPVLMKAGLLPPLGLALAAGVDNTAQAAAAGTLPRDGSLFVTSSGTLVAAGAGNLVAAGAGNLIGNAGGTLIGNAGGTVIASPQSSAALIGNDGAGLISQDGSGLISQDGSGLISQDGSGLISQDGAGLVAAGAGN